LCYVKIGGWCPVFGSIRKIIRYVRYMKSCRTIRKSGQFDTDFYLRRYPDVAEADIDPLFHYVRHGTDEGRRPREDFDTSFYVMHYPDIAGSRLNAFEHYLKYGCNEGRATSLTLWEAGIGNAGDHSGSGTCAESDGKHNDGTLLENARKSFSWCADWKVPGGVFAAALPQLKPGSDSEISAILDAEILSSSVTRGRLWVWKGVLNCHVSLWEKKGDLQEASLFIDGERWESTVDMDTLTDPLQPGWRFSFEFPSCKQDSVGHEFQILMKFGDENELFPSDPVFAYFDSEKLSGRTLGILSSQVPTPETTAAMLSNFGLFDPNHYERQRGIRFDDAVAAITDYTEYGFLNGLDPHPLFQTRYYFEQRPGLKAAKAEPFLHYLTIGHAEGMSFSPLFDRNRYANRRPCFEFGSNNYVSK
jgi:hypothetical protein